MTDEENTNEIENTIDNSIWDDDNPIKDHDYGYVNTAEDIEQTGVDSQDDNIRPTGVTTIDHDIGTTGVKDPTAPLQPEPEIDEPNEMKEQYEYVNLQGVFGDKLSNKTIEELTRMNNKTTGIPLTSLYTKQGGTR